MVEQELPLDKPRRRRTSREARKVHDAIVFLRKAGVKVWRGHGHGYRVARGSCSGRELKRLARTMGWVG